MVNIFNVKGRKKVRMNEFGNHVLNDLRNEPRYGIKVQIRDLQLLANTLRKYMKVEKYKIEFRDDNPSTYPTTWRDF